MQPPAAAGPVPALFRNQIFIPAHGSRSRSRKSSYRITLVKPGPTGRPADGYEPIAEGWLQGRQSQGRPVGLLVLPDSGALVIADQAVPYLAFGTRGKRHAAAPDNQHLVYLHRMNRPVKRVLGRRELVDFPAFDLGGVEAKVDTGAYTSAIHCTDIHIINTDAEPRPVLVVHLLDPAHEGTNGRPLAFTDFALRDIRSSNGEVQERYVIRAVVQLYGENFEVDFSLSDRSDMKYPVLLGRSLLRQGRFVVDVAKRNLSYKFLARAAARRTRH